MMHVPVQKFTFRRQMTGSIPYNADAATVEAALRRLSSIGDLEVVNEDSTVLCSNTLTDRDTNLRVRFTSEVRAPVCRACAPLFRSRDASCTRVSRAVG